MNDRVLFSKKLLIINSASSLVTRLLSVTVLIWVQQYLLKHISVEEYSLLPVIYSLIMFSPLLTAILTGGIKRYVLVAYAEGDDRRITQIVSSMFPVLCLQGLLLLLLGVLLAWNIDSVLRIDPTYIDDARLMLILVLLLEALRLPVEAFNSGLYAKQRFVLANLITVGCECIRLTLLFVLLLGFSVSVVSVVIATVVAGLVEGVVLFVVSRRLLPSQRLDPAQFDWSVVKELTKFGGWSSLVGFSGMIRKAADPIILNRLSTPMDVACFHLGALIPNRLEIIINQSFLGSVSPVVVGLHADQQHAKLKHMYLRLGRLAMWAVLLVIAPFMVHYQQIVILYVGEEYSAAGTVMLLLLACYPIIYGNILYAVLANAKIRMRALAIRESIAALINLVLTIVLVGYYELGAVGAALSTLLVHGLGSMLLFWPFGKSMVGASWREVWTEVMLPGIVPWLVSLLVMTVLMSVYPADSWASIALSAVLGGCAYLVALWWVAKEVDKAQLLDVWGKLVARVRGN